MTVARKFIHLLTGFTLLHGLPAAATESMNYWNVDKLLSIGAQEIELTNEQGKTLGKVQYDRLLVMNEVRKRIEKSSDVKSDFYIVTGDKPNAFATNVITGRNLFAINLPMIDEIGHDPDALAALMGHEIAHIERNHIRQQMEAARDIQTGSQIASVFLVLAGVHGAGAISDLGANLIFGSYSRDQEREADSYGLEFAAKAGFNPYGGVRLFTRISEKRGDMWLSFLSTHPSHDERIQEMRSIAGRRPDRVALETDVTSMNISKSVQLKLRAAALGEYRATVFDTEERVPTLHQRIRCKLPGGAVIQTTRIDCIQQEGSIP